MTTRRKNGLASRIRAHRKARGLSASELARRAGLARTHVSLIERGTRRTPSIETVQAIARALGVSVSELLGDT